MKKELDDLRLHNERLSGNERGTVEEVEKLRS
jgi:hypothetical protein